MTQAFNSATPVEMNLPLYGVKYELILETARLPEESILQAWPYLFEQYVLSEYETAYGETSYEYDTRVKVASGSVEIVITLSGIAYAVINYEQLKKNLSAMKRDLHKRWKRIEDRIFDAVKEECRATVATSKLHMGELESLIERFYDRKISILEFRRECKKLKERFKLSQKLDPIVIRYLRKMEEAESKERGMAVEQSVVDFVEEISEEKHQGEDTADA